MFGWNGRILRIDLTQGASRVEDTPAALMEYIGGRGMGARILFDEIDPRIDALSPANKLIFATGPCTGSGAPAASRFIVSAKSPLSNCVASPCCGGYFGANMKYSGYDLVIVEGRSPEPVYVTILNDRVEINPASHLWGKALRDGNDDPAGDENTVRPRQLGTQLHGHRRHRSRGGKPGEVRQHHVRRRTGRGTVRSGRRDGLEEPQGPGGPWDRTGQHRRRGRLPKSGDGFL